jgi:hypothetical protein
MKTALQEAEEAEGEEGKQVMRDAKGKEIISEEEKARREEKERKASAEVSLYFFFELVQQRPMTLLESCSSC